MLWVEKYRPTTFDDIAGNRNTIEEVRRQVESGEMDHMAFFGPPGTGKTTTAQVIARNMFGSVDDTNFKELNASDERGISVIRKQVKKFAGKRSLDNSFKIIFLDEADNLTPDAQEALRRIMEKYHETCRFILTGNRENGITPALRSRCNVYKFEPVSQEEARRALERIVEAESLGLDGEVLSKLTQIYDGDLRSQVKKLQTLSQLDDVSADDLESGEDYKTLYNFVGKQEFMAAKRVADEETLRRMYNYMMDKDEIPGRVKAEVSIIMGKYMWRIDRSSADEKIQINALVAELIQELSKHVKN